MNENSIEKFQDKLTWEQKFMAMQTLGECRLMMRQPGDWYVSQSVEIKSGMCLEGRYGNGVSPYKAIEDHWDKLTVLKPGEYVVVGGTSEKREAFEWKGFMWARVNEKTMQEIYEK